MKRLFRIPFGWALFFMCSCVSLPTDQLGVSELIAQAKTDEKIVLAGWLKDLGNELGFYANRSELGVLYKNKCITVIFGDDTIDNVPNWFSTKVIIIGRISRLSDEWKKNAFGGPHGYCGNDFLFRLDQIDVAM